jgi:hypothetical protein
MLELRPNCECCNKDLRPTATDAMICTFECTFCRDCADTGWVDAALTAEATSYRAPFVHSQSLGSCQQAGASFGSG